MNLANPAPATLRLAAHGNLRRHVRFTDRYGKWLVQWRATGLHLGDTWRTTDTTWGWRCHRGLRPVEGDHYYTTRGHAAKALLLHVADEIERECSDEEGKKAQ